MMPTRGSLPVLSERSALSLGFPTNEKKPPPRIAELGTEKAFSLFFNTRSVEVSR